MVSNRSLRITSGGTAHIFKGNSLTISGTGNGNNFKGQIMGWGGQANVTISNLVVYQSTIQCNNEGWFYLRGKMTVRDTATGERVFTGINQNTNGGRNFDFLGTVVTTDGESPKVNLTHGKNAANTYTTFKMSCDLTDSRAWFEVKGQNNGLAIFLLDTATFGLAFDSVKTNAIQLLKNSKFVLTANGVQNANLGISVPAAQTAYFGTRTYSASGNCSGTQYDYPDYDLTLPVFGSGTFTKEDDGRITLRNDWSGFHGTLAIEGGSLVLTDDMTASSDMRVVVKAGGALETERTDGTYGGWGADVVNGTNNVVEVRVGGVTTMKTTNVDKLCYTFKDGGGIAVFQTPPNATQETYGLYSTFTHERAFSHEAPIRVKLVPDEPSTSPTSRFSRTICTIPQALNPKTDFAVDKPWDGWRGDVTRADDTPSAGMYRYTVTYRPVGMTILFL